MLQGGVSAPQQQRMALTRFDAFAYMSPIQEVRDIFFIGQHYAFAAERPQVGNEYRPHRCVNRDSLGAEVEAFLIRVFFMPAVKGHFGIGGP